MTPRPEIIEFLEKNKYRRFCNSSCLPKPEKGFCKWCGGKLPNGLRVWCSGRCRNEAYIRFGYVENQVHMRDKGVCFKCGIDCDAIGYEIRELKRVYRHHRHLFTGGLHLMLGWWWTHNYRVWEADHILPVCEGGGCCGLGNYRTLCLRCHKQETATLSKTRAFRKRAQKEKKSMSLNRSFSQYVSIGETLEPQL